jgi:putative ABC transport system permease protein
MLALKMLIGNRASCIGVIFGIFLATLLISQQSAIFLGLVSRSYRIVTDITAPNVWIMDPATESDEKLRTMPAGYLDIVRGIPGIEWAVPIRIANLPLTTPTGIFHITVLYGIDDATLIGAPTQIVEGDVKDLRYEGAIIIDTFSAKDTLAHILPDGTKVPLKIGDEIEINGQRSRIVGICKITQGFYPQPIIFTSSSSFRKFTSFSNDKLAFIVAQTKETVNLNDVLTSINANPRLHALSRDQFKERIVDSFLKTGILINFALSVGLGIIIGLSIAGQIFYIMTLENLMYYALLKALGTTQIVMLQMIIFQAMVVGVIGYFLGIATTILWGIAVKGTTLAFLFPWQLLAFTAVIILFICIFTAALSITKVLRLDPKVLMGT